MRRHSISGFENVLLLLPHLGAGEVRGSALTWPRGGGGRPRPARVQNGGAGLAWRPGASRALRPEFSRRPRGAVGKVAAAPGAPWLASSEWRLSLRRSRSAAAILSRAEGMAGPWLSPGAPAPLWVSQSGTGARCRLLLSCNRTSKKIPTAPFRGNGGALGDGCRTRATEAAIVRLPMRDKTVLTCV